MNIGGLPCLDNYDSGLARHEESEKELQENGMAIPSVRLSIQFPFILTLSLTYIASKRNSTSLRYSECLLRNN